MKKKLFCIALVLVLCLSAYSAAFAATRQASGYCFMNNSGRSVSFGGYSSSAQTEDTIGVTIILWEKEERNGTRSTGHPISFPGRIMWMRPGQRRWMAVITIKLPARTPHPRTARATRPLRQQPNVGFLKQYAAQGGPPPKETARPVAVFQPISRIRCMVSSNSSADSSRLLKFTLYPAPNASA